MRMLTKQQVIVGWLLFVQRGIPVARFDLQRLFKKGSLIVPGVAVCNGAQVMKADRLVLNRIQVKITVFGPFGPLKEVCPGA